MSKNKRPKKKNTTAKQVNSVPEKRGPSTESESLDATPAVKQDSSHWLISYFRSIGLVSLLSGSAAFLALPEYFTVFVFLIYLSIIVLTLDFFFEFRIRGLIPKFIGTIVVLVLLFGFTFIFVLVEIPLHVFVQSSDADYPEGTTIGNIKWSSKFNELRVIIRNPTEYDFYDIDLVLQPNEPIAKIGQITSMSGVSFKTQVDLTLRPELVEPAKGKRTALPLTLIATDGGYRMYCEELPKKQRIEIVMAIVKVNDTKKQPGGDVFDKSYVLKASMTDGSAYWYGYQADEPNEEVFGPRPVAKSIKANGVYTAFARKKKYHGSSDISDHIKDIMPKMLTR